MPQPSQLHHNPAHIRKAVRALLIPDEIEKAEAERHLMHRACPVPVYRTNLYPEPVPARSLDAGQRPHPAIGPIVAPDPPKRKGLRSGMAVPDETAPLSFRARGITKIYRMGETVVEALRGIDLDIARGELVVLLGPSGSGKSTLLNILGGLDHPTSGEIFFDGQELTASDDRALTRFRRSEVGFIFQFYNLMPSLTARENVALVTEIADDPMPPEEALALVGLADRMDHFPSQLSGGEQQRVAVARAVAKQPSVLLCDEPTGALDSQTGVQVLVALETVNARLGTTTIVITHNVGIAAMANRVVELADGRIARIRTNETRMPARDLKW